MMVLERLRPLLRTAADSFLLREVETRVASRPASTAAAIERLSAGAARRTAAADQLAREDEAIAAITLYREAAALLIEALLVEQRGTQPEHARVSIEASWAAFDESVPATVREALPTSLPVARRVLATDDIALADELSLEEQSAARDACSDVVHALRRAVEPRSLERVRATRYFRIAVAAAITIALLAWLVIRVSTPNNIARGTFAMASSRYPGTPDASGITNGVIEGTYGVHTNVEASPWITVDLGRPRALREVKVYGRGDGFEAESVPIVLDVSENGVDFEEVANRGVPFTRSSPWSISFDSRSVRSLRLRRPHSGYIAIAEIEAFAAH